MAQSQITLTKFSGGDDESWTEFEALLRGTITVTYIAAARQAGFLRLHLDGPALTFFQTLGQNVQDNFEGAITALKNHYCNPQFTELHKIRFDNQKFDPKRRHPKIFW